jgi:uncharacterized protein YdaU (DUF1376 family)
MSKKKKDPSLQIYTAQFLADTQFWSLEERGIYITLICVHHQNGFIPKEIMYQLTGGVTNPEKEYPLMMGHFIKGNNGNYVHPQTGQEMKRREEYSKAQSDRGKKAHNSKANAGSSAPAFAGQSAPAETWPRDKTEHSNTNTNSFIHSSQVHSSTKDTITDPLEDLYLG